jgi:hypothetical protein
MPLDSPRPKIHMATKFEIDFIKKEPFLFTFSDFMGNIDRFPAPER